MQFLSQTRIAQANQPTVKLFLAIPRLTYRFHSSFQFHVVLCNFLYGSLGCTFLGVFSVKRARRSKSQQERRGQQQHWQNLSQSGETSSCLSSKLKTLHALVLSIFLYVCEAWTLTAELQRKIQAVEMRCLRRVLGISYTEHVTNETVRAIITIHMKRYEELLTTVRKTAMV